MGIGKLHIDPLDQKMHNMCWFWHRISESWVYTGSYNLCTSHFGCRLHCNSDHQTLEVSDMPRYSSWILHVSSSTFSAFQADNALISYTIFHCGIYTPSLSEVIGRNTLITCSIDVWASAGWLSDLAQTEAEALYDLKALIILWKYQWHIWNKFDQKVVRSSLWESICTCPGRDPAPSPDIQNCWTAGTDLWTLYSYLDIWRKCCLDRTADSRGLEDSKSLQRGWTLSDIRHSVLKPYTSDSLSIHFPPCMSDPAAGHNQLSTCYSFCHRCTTNNLLDTEQQKVPREGREELLLCQSY